MEESSKKLKNAKLFGGIGGILMLTGMIPYVGYLLTLAGLILEILGVKKISEVIEKKEVFKDYIKGIIIGVVSGLIAFFFGLLLFFLEFGELPQKPSRAEGYIITMITKLGLRSLIIILIYWICGIFGSYFIKRSFGKIKEETQVNYFSLAGDLFFWGAILTIALVGMILFFMAHIITIVAFFSLPKKLPKKETA